MTTFENGKKYDFTLNAKENGFAINRESGKLLFTITDPTTGHVYRVRPREFQKRHIPETLHCIYHNGFEQDFAAIYAEIYEPGQEYDFRVINVTGEGLYTLQDDANGISLQNVKLNAKLTRFQRIKCKVAKINGAYVRLKYVSQDKKTGQKFFGLDNLVSLPQASQFRGCGHLLTRLLSNNAYSISRRMLDSKDPQWLVTLASTLRSALAQMPNNATVLRRRRQWLMRIHDLAISVIENSNYLETIEAAKRATVQQTFCNLARDCEDYHYCACMIINGEGEKYVKEVLESLSRTGWLYKPEVKMRRIVTLFTLDATLANNYIADIFTLIADRHSDNTFMGTFKQSIATMLAIFIDNESANLNYFNAKKVSDLLRALAIELLLTVEDSNDSWSYYRGWLYTAALLSIGESNDTLVCKALWSFADLYDAKLEFGWADISDITHLARVRLTETPEPIDTESCSAFEGEKYRILLNSKGIQIQPADTMGFSPKRVVRHTPAKGLECEIYLCERPDTTLSAINRNIETHHNAWQEIIRIITSGQTTAPSSTIKRSAKYIPSVGDDVTIRITGRDDSAEFQYTCEIIDNRFSGTGFIAVSDIVLYPIDPDPAVFRIKDDNSSMLFSAKITGIRDDGSFHFNMRESVMDRDKSIAQEDKDLGEPVDAIVTEAGDGTCKAVSELAYPIIVKGAKCTHFSKGDWITVSIDNVNRNMSNHSLYINGTYIEKYDNDQDPQESIIECFGDMLKEICVSSYTDPVSAVEDKGPEAAPDGTFITTKDVAGIATVLGIAAWNKYSTPSEAYDLQAFARVLNLCSNGDSRQDSVTVIRLALLRTLCRYTVNKSLDDDARRTLAEAFDSGATSDSIVRYLTIQIRIPGLMDTPGWQELMESCRTDASEASPRLVDMCNLVAAYNLLQGMSMSATRHDIRRRILEDLRVPFDEKTDIESLGKESSTLEFKSSLVYPANNNMKPDDARQGREVMQVIDGMLNSDGGTLYIGVNDSGIPIGLENDFMHISGHCGLQDYDERHERDHFELRFEDNLRHMLGMTCDGRQLMPEYVSISFQNASGNGSDKTYACIIVKPFPGLVTMDDGQVFLRNNTSTVPMKNNSEIESRRTIRRMASQL